MKTGISTAPCALGFTASSSITLAAYRPQVPGKDYVFQHACEDLPQLSDFKGLQINSFRNQRWREAQLLGAGAGKPLVFIPGWSATSAEYISNVSSLLSKHHRVYVLDPRNQGFSQHTYSRAHASRVSRQTLRNFRASRVESGRLLRLVDGGRRVVGLHRSIRDKRHQQGCVRRRTVSIYLHADWSEQERLDAGGMTLSAERRLAPFYHWRTGQQPRRRPGSR